MRQPMILLVVLCTLPLLISASIRLKSCSAMNIDAVGDFDAARYLGLWYEIKRFPNFFESGICTTAEYALINSTFITVKNSELISNNQLNSIEGYAKLEDPTKPDGKLLVKFPQSRESPYWVIGTDYTSYAVIWSCTDIIKDVSYQLSWVLSRTPQLSANAEAAVDEIIKNSKLNPSVYRTTEQGSEACGRD